MRKTRSIVVNEEFGQMIREAEIMMRGSDPEQRERGLQKLRDVASQAEGSVYAQIALEKLAAAEPRFEEAPDPELEELMKLWPSIMGFDDYRLTGFLIRLESHKGMALPLRTDVVREVRRWIADALAGVDTELNSPKTESLNEFVAAVRGVSAFEALPEFGPLRDRLFQRRLQETGDRVYAALAIWELAEAQRTIRELLPFPDAFKSSVERLQAEIDEADSLRQRVDRLLEQLPDHAPANWFEARLQVELQQQLRQCRSNNRVPHGWRLHLDQALSTLSEFIRQFISGQAQAAVTIPLLRDFSIEFERLRGEKPDSRVEVSEHWFAPVADTLSASASKDVGRAISFDELMAIANRLRAEAEGIPPPVASRISTIAESVSSIATAWRLMEEGQSFALSVDGGDLLPAPRALAAECQRYSEWIMQIETALNSLVTQTSLQSKPDYYDHLRLAESILTEVPHHALALKLQQEAKRRLTCYKLDQELWSWSVESFFTVLETDSPSEIYRGLIPYKDVLVELRDLTQQRPLKNWRSAGDWWARWQAVIKRLPLARPDALITALDQQTAKRQLERYATLDRLLHDNLTLREYENAASSLEQETDSNLKSYRQELLRRVAIGHVEDHITNGRFDNAAKELESLPSSSTDGMRLRTRLEVEQSRRRGSETTAEYLFKEWENVRAYVDHPDRLLLETITAVWMEERHDAVLKMSRLISRLLREATESQVTRKLVEWQTWIEIEEGLIRNFSSGGVKHLAEYLRSVEPGELLDARLKRVLRHWQSEGNTVMLAWAYQAFQRITTVARQFDEAAHDLVKESEQIGNDIDSVLTESATLNLDDLKSLQASLQWEEDRWRSLHDFLSLVAHPVEHPQPSLKLIGANERVSEVLRILTSLDRLKDADLRQPQLAQDYDDAYSRVLRRQGVASRSYMLEQLERWRPLREDLFSLEKRIRETAERCSSKEALNVLEPALFDQLAGYVRKVVEIFVKASARDGAMWMVVSAEYESKIYQEACVLLPVSGSCQLDQLVQVLEDLHAEELNFTQALSLLEDRDRQPNVARGSTFDPIPHLDYLVLIPKREPRSLKVYHRFERARRDTLKLILEAPESRPHLPVWVLNYLDNGVPVCASSR